MQARQFSAEFKPALLADAPTPNVCPLARAAEASRQGGDRFVVLILSLARFVGAAYCTDEAGCWEAAHRCAEDVLGASDGPLFVARAAALVRVIRRYRGEEFAYWPSSCSQLSRDENTLMLLIEAARSGDSLAMEEAAAAILGKKRGVKALREAASDVAALSCALAARSTPLYAALRRSDGGFARKRRA